MTTNYLEKITELYVFVSSDEGGEGVIGQTVEIEGKPVFMPFVCAEKARMESIKPMAKMIAQHTGKTVRLIKLTNREELEVFNKNKENK